MPNKCGECKHFVGWGDWGLCCDLKYDLCYEDTDACEQFEAYFRTKKQRSGEE